MNSKKDKRSQTDKLKEGFEITCKKCGSNDTYLNYQEEYSYSEYTSGGSSVTFYCRACGNEHHVDGY